MEGGRGAPESNRVCALHLSFPGPAHTPPQEPDSSLSGPLLLNGLLLVGLKCFVLSLPFFPTHFLSVWY